MDFCWPPLSILTQVYVNVMQCVQYAYMYMYVYGYVCVCVEYLDVNVYIK